MLSSRRPDRQVLTLPLNRLNPNVASGKAPSGVSSSMRRPPALSTNLTTAPTSGWVSLRKRPSPSGKSVTLKRTP